MGKKNVLFPDKLAKTIVMNPVGKGGGEIKPKDRDIKWFLSGIPGTAVQAAYHIT